MLHGREICSGVRILEDQCICVTLDLPHLASDCPQVPPWVWHQVDYVDDSPHLASDDEHPVAVGASIFHFYPMLYAKAFPLFSFLLVPNLIKEYLGINIE